MAAYTTIDDPEAYFQVELYTGDGSGQSTTFDGDTNMQPDWVWIKERSGDEPHAIFDSVRGVQKHLDSASTTAEETVSTSLTAFDSDGFTVGSWSRVNGSSETYVAWCWKAGTSFTNDASATSVGNTDSSGSASSTAGFSIATYAGVGSSLDVVVKHGLSVVPAVMIIKNLSSDSWAVYHHKNTAAPETDYLKLDTNSATTDDADAAETWHDTAPTSAVFTAGDFSATNRSGNNHIGYFWNEVQGFSKFGTFQGNGANDGPTINTGFRPAFVMVKATSRTGNWGMNDNKRDPYNLTSHTADANNATDSDDTAIRTDLLSNGFKIRTDSSNWNGDGETYVYMAWAEAPFVNSNGVPCNAR